jgi:hypothetical protein
MYRRAGSGVDRSLHDPTSDSLTAVRDHDAGATVVRRVAVRQLKTGRPADCHRCADRSRADTRRTTRFVNASRAYFAGMS